jgi:predicted aconitase with swiveling domain
MTIVAAQCVVEGEARGALALWDAPLSFWGGLDAATGRVIDRTHPAFGQSVAGRILVMRSGRGSSSASSVLAEAIRLGTAPSAIVLGAPDPIIAIGAIVAAKLYGKACPIAICALEALDGLRDGEAINIIVRDARLQISTP